MTDANERDATLAQRIRDALRGVTEGEWRYNTLTEQVRGGEQGRVICDIGCWDQNDRDGHLIAAAPSLLRDALARIEADAATIAALEDAVRERNAALAEVWRYAGDGGERPAPAQVADAVHEMWRYKLSLENGLPDDYDDNAR